MLNLVTLNKNNQLTTTSQIIADTFGREHKSVLKTIKSLDAPQDFIERNFAPYSYTAKNGKENPAYEITRDGFTLLAMGFTGKKAMEWKVKYIQAFNAMEAKLKELSSTPTRLNNQEAFKQLMREVIREEMTPYVLSGGVKRSEPHNGYVTADGLPAANWIVGIIHGANALSSCLNQLEQRNNELLAEWSGLNAKTKEIKQITDSCRIDAIK